MNIKRCMLIGVILVFCFALSGCSNKKSSMRDGYFSAEMADYYNGWKEFVTIYVKDDTIISVEYNAKNASGFIKSWDMAYMRNMNGVKGTYPNRYTREYGKQVLEKQSSEQIDVVAGATSSYDSFQKLIAAAIEMSQLGKNEMAIVSNN
jgi:major membrane immunogen (membrane-anchored lipoprotein)